MLSSLPLERIKTIYKKKNKNCVLCGLFDVVTDMILSKLFVWSELLNSMRLTVVCLM